MRRRGRTEYCFRGAARGVAALTAVRVAGSFTAVIGVPRCLRVAGGRACAIHNNKNNNNRLN